FGYRQHPATLFEERRDAILDESYKGFDRSQTRVAGTGTIAPLGLKMREKIHHQMGIEMLQTQVRRGQSQPLAGEGEQQLKGIGVAVRGVLTGPQLQRRLPAQ